MQKWALPLFKFPCLYSMHGLTGSLHVIGPDFAPSGPMQYDLLGVT